ncbi:hypothetical protein ACFQYP_13625 [Nonomuraea antimicrobica]
MPSTFVHRVLGVPVAVALTVALAPAAASATAVRHPAVINGQAPTLHPEGSPTTPYAGRSWSARCATGPCPSCARTGRRRRW